MGETRDRYEAISLDALEAFDIVDHRAWVEPFTNRFGEQYPGHGDTIGMLDELEDDDLEEDDRNDISIRTTYRLRIPEGWEASGRVWALVPGGLGTHLSGLQAIEDNLLTRGRAIMTVNSLEVATLTPETIGAVRTFGKRTNRTIRKVCRFLHEFFAPCTGVYAAGFSRGAWDLARSIENASTKIMGLLGIQGGYNLGSEWVGKQWPSFLKHGLSQADDPSLVVPISLGSQLGAKAFLELILPLADPTYRGIPADYDLRTRPRRVRRFFASLDNSGRIPAGVKTILAASNHDGSGVVQAQIRYMGQVVDQGAADRARFYVANHYDHGGFSFPPIGNREAMLPELIGKLERWVDHGEAPDEWLVDLPQSGGGTGYRRIQNSRQSGLTSDPLTYAVERKQGKHASA